MINLRKKRKTGSGRKICLTLSYKGRMKRRNGTENMDSDIIDKSAIITMNVRKDQIWFVNLLEYL